MKIVAIKELLFRGMWNLVIVSVGYGGNSNILSVYENVDWMACHSDYRFLSQKVLFTIKQFSKPERL